MNTIERIALDRLNLLATSPGSTDPNLATAALTELARTGIRLREAGALTTDLALRVPAIAAHARLRRGERGTYTPLFDGFPDRLPEQDDVWMRALLGALRLSEIESPTDTDLRAAFDFADLGWWPASSVPQDVPATVLARARQQTLLPDGHTEWWDVRVVTPAELDVALREFMVHAFTSPVSLREDVRTDLEALARHYGVAHIDASTVTFLETRTLMSKLAWEQDPATLAALGLGPDDLLRLFASLTDSDVSLGTPIRYPRFTRAQRRAVIATLESSPRLADIFRRRGMWLALGRGLHLAEHKAPRTQDTFARLRATRHDETALLSRFERTLVHDFAGALDLLVAEAPTLVLRHLRRLTSLAGRSSARQKQILAAAESASAQAPLPVLLAARHQIADNGATYPRVVLTKSGRALTIDRDKGHLALSAPFRAKVLEVLTRAVRQNMADRKPWDQERVHIAPGLDRILVPEALRSTSAGLIQVERGSSLPAGSAPVMRLFTHWKSPNADLDLSLLALGEDFNVVEQVSWTNLRRGAIVHSGDITSAPAGAQEFIDIDMSFARSQVQQSGWRYLAPAIYRYSGPTFDELEEAVAGWMLRDKPSRNRVAFDPAAVVNAFALTGTQRTALPFLLDVATGELVYLDMYLPGSEYSAAGTHGEDVGQMARALTARGRLKTDVASLVREHAAARGAVVVEDRNDATLTVGMTSADTYDVLRPEKFLTDLF